MWVEDPILRNDFEGLRLLRQSAPWTLINSGEYLDAAGKRELMLAGGTDILNVHGQVTDVMRTGWLAAELGVPVSLGNTFLEFGVHMACALPEVEWLEYSFQNFDHLVEQPIEFRPATPRLSQQRIRGSVRRGATGTRDPLPFAHHGHGWQPHFGEPQRRATSHGDIAVEGVRQALS